MVKKEKKKNLLNGVTRASEDYYNHYTKNNKYPLYIIRNYKTGKAYQMAISPDKTWDKGNYVKVNFLDQNDVNGDEITNGDLSKIPDNLLKLIKFNGKNLAEYKNTNMFTKAEYEGEKGYTNKETESKKEAKKFPKTMIEAANANHEAGITPELIEKYGEPMYQVGSHGHHLKNPKEFDDKKPIEDFFNGKPIKIDKKKKAWLKKAGTFKIYFSKVPEQYCIIAYSVDGFETSELHANNDIKHAAFGLFESFILGENFHLDEKDRNVLYGKRQEYISKTRKKNILKQRILLRLERKK